MRDSLNELLLPTIPGQIVVHLGAPNEPAQNVTVDFIDYISNVASSEIYPTWLSSAIIANILAQISFALNRVYTEYYRARGYDFDITSLPAYDQRYTPGGVVFENISLLVNEVFDSYIRRKGYIEPLYASYCDGINTTCDGLSQWGSLSLAQNGLSAFEILQYYYGDDIEIVEDVPIVSGGESVPQRPLRVGSVGNDVRLLQLRLNRVSTNYPSIPKIKLTNGIFANDTEDAVKAFQRIFSLEVDGIVGRATWYKVLSVYNAVKKLNELISEGLTIEDVLLEFPEVLKPGDRGLYISVLQYYLNFVSAFDSRLTDIEITGVFDEATENAVKAFQETKGIEQTGIVDDETGVALYDQYLGIINTMPDSAFDGIARPFPGTVLSLGSRGDDVKLLQSYINVLAENFDEIATIEEDGIFGQETLDNIYAIQSLFDLTVDGVVSALTWAAIADAYDDVVSGNLRSEGQYPGYDLGGEQ